jgi:GDP-D-mannose 3', 5'-epimerase
MSWKPMVGKVARFAGPVNIGSDEMVTIDQLVDIVAGIAGKTIKKRHIDGPTGVRGRNSDNRLIREKLNWSPSTVLAEGLRPTYQWISSQLTRNVQSGARCPDHLPLKLRVGSR